MFPCIRLYSPVFPKIKHRIERLERMSRPFVVDSPEIKYPRLAEFVFIGGSAETQHLGYRTSKSWRMFWATETEVNTKITEIIGSGWVMEGEPSLSPIYPPLDLYNAELTAHKHTET